MRREVETQVQSAAIMVPELRGTIQRISGVPAAATAVALQWSPPSWDLNPWTGETGWTADLKAQEASRATDPSLARVNEQRAALPTAAAREKVLQAIAQNQVIVVTGGTGSGKTTQIPQYIIEDAATSGVAVNIACTQPRRLAAISVAERVAAERGETLRKSVGYSVRFDSQFPRQTVGTICYMTVGIMLKRLSNGLHGISHLIIDEVHERDTDTDFLLCVLRQSLHNFPELCVILMSASVNSNQLTKYFGCPLVAIPGALYPVEKLFINDALRIVSFTRSPADKEFEIP